MLRLRLTPVIQLFQVVTSSWCYIMTARSSRICLFDVDGTLTQPRQKAHQETLDFLLKSLKPVCQLGIVSGSDMKKVVEQVGGESVLEQFDYVFPENGLVAYKNGKLFDKKSIVDHMGEEKLQSFINYCLRHLSNVTLPFKRGNFIEFRTGLINVSPVGRSCTQEERDAFEKYDKEHHVRQTLIEKLKQDLPDIGLTYSIGGQISFDAFPNGFDKTYCLKYLEKEFPNQIYFFGDKTFPGGNDFEIFNDKRTSGHSVTSPQHTVQTLKELFALK
uniref:Phosphomannomutase n=1 Tax=Cacopsylla melanoneura TaxID=428564 RepID=A0A8D8YC29_9HEMI